jgi:hypothetical protein
MPLDFARAAALFMGSEEELARALSISVADLRAARTTPANVRPELLARIGAVLKERGSGMKRVGEMLLEDFAPEPRRRAP